MSKRRDTSMVRYARSLCLLLLVALLSGAIGHALPRPVKKGGDLLDAVAAVQRHRPLFLIPERGLPYSWAAAGGIYLSSTGKTPEEVEQLVKDPRSYDDRWSGVVYFKACGPREDIVSFMLPDAGDLYLDYGGFAVYGDPALLQEVRVVLADQGLRPALR
jgi:hypothetical protein